MRALRLGGESKVFLLVVAACIAVIVGTFLMRPGTSDRATDSERGAEARAEGLPTTPPARPHKAKAKAKLKRSADAQAPATLGGFAVPPPSFLAPGGLEGNGGSISLPKHKLTIRWHSGNPLGLVAYIVPTSRDHNKGSWVERSRHDISITTTVYGRPDYAIAYVQAGGTGEPATCEIFVDGRRTAHRTTQGPYGAVWCQG